MSAPATTASAQQQITRKAQPALELPQRAAFRFEGLVGDRIRANQENWLLPAPNANPAMLEMYRDRETSPGRALEPWAGEFAGKYLISAVQALRLTGDSRLRTHLEAFVKQLIACQGDDGYLGPWSHDRRFTGNNLWDIWGHYHVMYGLYLWYKDTGDPASLAACRKAADLICHTFLDGSIRVINAGCEEMNQSSIHIFTLLYEETGEPRYLQLAREIEKDWQVPPSGDYYRSALAGTEFHLSPKPRWESLPSLQALTELHYVTGEPGYRKAAENFWWSILAHDRHNTGGFSSGEQAVGNPYDPRPIETCCTVAWMAFTQDMLRLSGNSRVADELELSTFNGALGAQHPSGRWWTYNTPMDGAREASAHTIVFQARPGSPELNCCSVNAPRTLGMLSEWAVMNADDGVAVNYYGPGVFALNNPRLGKLRIEQKTAYPADGTVRMTVSPESSKEFTVRMRIPGWSRETTVTVNGKRVDGVRAGTYLPITRTWKAGDEVLVQFDMGPWFWVGERECAGKVSVYYGPLLLACDQRFYKKSLASELPHLRLKGPFKIAKADSPSPRPFFFATMETESGEPVTLCDYASAGAAGTRYATWLPATGLHPAPFTRENPMRTVHPEKP